ncbi:MAG: hypothetical protein A2W61_02810 [Deltaproteobacteria bacterium RIFCSPLOWO2_01_44_7]|nr:MAG: hypothetical protein A2712_01085 [Deltaproteobacteria bacterium RIFCSPHIGHO2_01_FULL_43_49]OGQ15269.1 MAG: hypothetical protein A3D22_04390 [Deltaproteobacteria bacterium RIFCSPHIGHO2_02_FULL_44_53]OGQ27107.1 MAG: hypothetical protein A3D98_01675 [Deltaproteobacteria bacterium RIFCSPHIGHO2_12_FULL_44_21]OGQ31785.1 MAG: hypothetical protein A2979_05550 [Deltaproteobacteria bacterium RIFCSPLOWO2_01_FULL_45_74]OGQ39768.1 MAG: hypothetical protein A2W61_02810 [Deltaproteobacteria bacterium 
MDALQLPSVGVQQTKAKVQDCPLCGFQFNAGEAACGGCAMVSGCSMLKCPNCSYEFVAESRIVNWFQKVFKKVK